MKRIQLWSIDRNAVTANPAEGVDNTETEEFLEDLLVASPDLLEPGLNLIGRQMPCGGGYLDLLGIDQDGRIKIFELKRGALTRDAVAQVLDYGSELVSFDQDRFAKFVEENSGGSGIEKIDDFLDWYSQEYPNASDALSDGPKMVLVGLGVDDRARRIATFLADTGVEIELLTFEAFREQGRLFLARQVEVTGSVRPLRKSTSPSKEGNEALLLQRAEELGLEELLERVRAFLVERLPESSYCWPGKTAYSLSLPEKTAAGRPTLRTHLTLYVQGKPNSSLLLVFASRAVAAAREAVGTFCERVPEAVRDRVSWSALEIRITAETWPKISAPLTDLLDAVASGWKQASARTGEGA